MRTDPEPTRRRSWPTFLAAGLAVLALVATFVVTSQKPAAVSGPSPSSPRSAGTGLVTSSPSGTPPLAASETATASEPGGPPGFITIDQIPIHGYTEHWFLSREGVELTLGGPAVYFLDPVETIQTTPGEHLLTFYEYHCDSPLGCPTRSRGIPPRVLCTHRLTLGPGDTLLVRVDFSRTRCVRSVRRRPPRPSDPVTVTGQLLLGNRYCPYVLDRWGRFWDLRLPEGWAIKEFRYDPDFPGIGTDAGEVVANERDRIRVTGTRIGVHSTGCSMHQEDNFGAGYLVTGMTFVSNGH